MRKKEDLLDIKWNENGLIPAIMQDIETKQVLMLAYMNQESLTKTLETGETWFWSRSRKELWHKGATSGHIQKVIDIQLDCDRDTLLVWVEQTGVACHKGTYTCFGDEKDTKPSYQIINELIDLIKQRDQERPEGSYTTYLLEKGLDKILKKVGEEASEVIIAAKNQSHDEMTCEVSDLIYHLLVLLHQQKLPINDVLTELRKRYQK